MGRRENADSQTPHTDGFRYENAASQHSSFRAKARNLFRSRQDKGCERNGKRETPYSLRPPKRCFMQTVPRRKENTANEKDPSAALGMTIRDNAPPTRLSVLCDANLRPFGAPPSIGRRENAASRAPHEDGFRYENAASPHSSFRAKARNLFRSRSRKDVRGAGNGKPSAPCAPKKRCFMQTAPRRKKNTANEKDPSAALGITIREYYLLKKGGEATISTLNPEPNESKVKRGCEEMRIHFFTAPFSSAVLSQNLDDTIDLYRFRQVSIHTGFDAFFRIFIESIRHQWQKSSPCYLPVFCSPTQKGQNFRPDLREARFDKGSSIPQNVFLASGFAASP